MERYGAMICSGKDILYFLKSGLKIFVSVCVSVSEK